MHLWPLIILKIHGAAGIQRQRVSRGRCESQRDRFKALHVSILDRNDADIDKAVAGDGHRAAQSRVIRAICRRAAHGVIHGDVPAATGGVRDAENSTRAALHRCARRRLHGYVRQIVVIDRHRRGGRRAHDVGGVAAEVKRGRLRSLADVVLLRHHDHGGHAVTGLDRHLTRQHAVVHAMQRTATDPVAHQQRLRRRSSACEGENARVIACFTGRGVRSNHTEHRCVIIMQIQRHTTLCQRAAAHIRRVRGDFDHQRLHGLGEHILRHRHRHDQRAGATRDRHRGAHTCVIRAGDAGAA